MKDYSNYHNTNSNEKLTHDGLLLLEHSLDGFEGYDVLINSSLNSRMLVYQKYDAESTTKKVIGKISDIEHGNILSIDNANWLVTTFPEDNKIYRKAEIQLCNSTYPIKSNKTRVLKGQDDDGRNVYEDSYDTNFIPCIVENKISAGKDNGQLPLPEGRINITMKYQSADNLKINSEFEMYGNVYRIIDFDMTKVMNNKGIMVVLAERVVN